jgi:hypothetical protein
MIRTSEGTPVERCSDGSVPAFSDLGGYPLVYLDREDSTLCADCAGRADGDGERLTVTVHYEGEPETCDECGCEIASAYGPVADG